MLRRTKRLVSGKIWQSYYYNGRDESGKRVEIPLGADLNEAKRKWAALECTTAPVETGLMRGVFDRYLREVIPGKAPKRQADNIGCLKMLRLVFDSAPVDSITPQHVAQYRDKRGEKAPVRANRELSLLSHAFNYAREWGYTAKENPCTRVRKNKKTPRDFYADAAVRNAVYFYASVDLQDAMDLNYLTGQRPADVLKMRYSDIVDGAVEVRQNKTKKRLRILLDDGGTRTELGHLIDRIRARPRTVYSVFIVVSPSGKGLGKGALRLRFEVARKKAAESVEPENPALAARIRLFQFRDIRPKAASEMELSHASKLLGHTDQQITRSVYQRVGETVLPTK
jgi:integrase